MKKNSGAAYRNRELVLKMLLAENPNLKAIAKRIGTNPFRLKQFLERERISYPKYSRVGKRNSHWHGGRVVDRQGYVLIYCPNHPRCTHIGYVREHRLVMERVLGRYLLRGEVVHHKDKNPSNNAPENLEVFQTNADHLRHELKGKVPKWTHRTIRLQNKWLARGREILQRRIREKSERNASQSK